MATVSLRPMTDAEYESWHAAGTEAYAEAISRANGISMDAARLRAREQDGQLLPEGLQTPGTRLLIISDEADAEVGILWLGPHPDGTGAGYVFDIEIHEPHRNRGLGRATMLAAEELLRAAGTSAIGLNVFGFNEPARRLYESLGYEVVSTRMLKQLSPPSGRESGEA